MESITDYSAAHPELAVVGFLVLVAGHVLQWWLGRKPNSIIRNELQENGGDSIRDRIIRLEADVENIKGWLRSVDDKLGIIMTDIPSSRNKPSAKRKR